MRRVEDNEPAERAADLLLRASIKFNRAVARSAGSDSFLRLVLGLTPQALRCRALRALQTWAVTSSGLLQLVVFPPRVNHDRQISICVLP
jgi:hypothetical protein